MQINASEHVVPHDGLQAGMLGLDVVENTTYVGNEQVYRQQAVFSHVLFTRFTQTNVKYLTQIGTQHSSHVGTPVM